VRTQNELQILLKSNTVNLSNIESHVIKVAQDLSSNSLPKEEEVSLSSLVHNSAKPDNAIFKLFSKRVDTLIHSSLMKSRVGIVTGTENEWMNAMIKGSAFGLGFDDSPEKRVTMMLKELYLVFSHTLKVHHEWYVSEKATKPVYSFKVCNAPLGSNRACVRSFRREKMTASEP